MKWKMLLPVAALTVAAGLGPTLSTSADAEDGVDLADGDLKVHSLEDFGAVFKCGVEVGDSEAHVGRRFRFSPQRSQRSQRDAKLGFRVLFEV